MESAENNGHPSPQSTENIYNKPEIKSVIQWISYGDGETSIILAPPLNTGVEAWTQQINILSQSGRRVLIPVYPGHKRNPFEASGFSLELLAEEIIIFITQDLVGTAIDLVGWSLGGCLSALVAIKRPDLVRSLTLISTAPSFNEDVFGNTLNLHAELKAHQDILEIVFDGAEDIITCLSARTPINVLRYYYDALTRFNINSFLPDITSKVLLVHGQNDCVVDEISFSRLSKIPHAIPLKIDGHGHFIPLTASRLFNTELIRFINADHSYT